MPRYTFSDILRLYVAAGENKCEYNIIEHHQTRGACEAVHCFRVRKLPTSSAIFTTTDNDDEDCRPGRTTMSPMWSGKSASVEAAMKNMLAAATQEILDQWELFDEEDEERRDRSQQELNE